jgi:hypothetical protein
MVSGGGRTIAWNTENLPSSVTSSGVTESYTYNADLLSDPADGELPQGQVWGSLTP